MKICIKCNKEKNKSEFGNHKSTRDGLRNWCKVCCSEYKKSKSNYSKKYYTDNRDKILDYTQDYSKTRDNSPAKWSKIRSDKLTIDEETIRTSDNMTACRCFTCKNYFIPTYTEISSRIRALHGNGSMGAESHLYCSQECKNNCTTFGANSFKLEPRFLTDQIAARSNQSDSKRRILAFQYNIYGYIYCERCGKEEQAYYLHLHHTFPVVKTLSSGINKPLDLIRNTDGHILLCIDCHRLTHIHCK